jgi:ribosomal protein S18 acetylase RimI-like enzyme
MKDMKMHQLRRAQKEDMSSIVDFQLLMAKETENIQLEKKTVKAGVQAVFDNEELGCYYVCEDRSNVIASLLITYEWSDWRNALVWWIQSVYVLPEYRKQSVFKKMFLYLKKIVNNDNRIQGLRLYVDKRNTIAKTVYKNLGMSDAHYDMYEYFPEEISTK